MTSELFTMDELSRVKVEDEIIEDTHYPISSTKKKLSKS